MKALAVYSAVLSTVNLGYLIWLTYAVLKNPLLDGLDVDGLEFVELPTEVEIAEHVKDVVHRGNA